VSEIELPRIPGSNYEWLAHACSFEFKIPSQNYEGQYDDTPVTIDRVMQTDSSYLWALRHGPFCYDKKTKQFGHESMNSWRHKDFKKNFRFKSRDAAFAALFGYCRWATKQAAKRTKILAAKKAAQAATEKNK